MLFAPLEGFRRIEVTDHRKTIDYAEILKDLSDIHFPLVERFEWHYTPKHGSWLNMAESELGVLASQCLDRRISDKKTLSREVAAWQSSRNKNQTKADWRFTTADARIKLKRLYPRPWERGREQVRGR
jgi:hypothetical protein